MEEVRNMKKIQMSCIQRLSDDGSCDLRRRFVRPSLFWAEFWFWGPNWSAGRPDQFVV